MELVRFVLEGNSVAQVATIENHTGGPVASNNENAIANETAMLALPAAPVVDQNLNQKLSQNPPAP